MAGAPSRTGESLSMRAAEADGDRFGVALSLLGGVAREGLSVGVDLLASELAILAGAAA
jgi:hypothetical protein